MDRLRALGPEYADFEPGGAPGRLAPLASLCRLSTALAGKVRAALRAEDKDRAREWRARREESLSSDQGAVYRWLKDESYAPPGHLPLQAGWHSHGQPGGDGWPRAGHLAPH